MTVKDVNNTKKMILSSEQHANTQQIKLILDHAAFAFYAGIPSINLSFRVDKKKHEGVWVYPSYHTGYDTFYLVDKILDPGNNSSFFYSCYLIFSLEGECYNTKT